MWTLELQITQQLKSKYHTSYGLTHVFGEGFLCSYGLTHVFAEVFLCSYGLTHVFAEVLLRSYGLTHVFAEVFFNYYWKNTQKVYLKKFPTVFHKFLSKKTIVVLAPISWSCVTS